MSDARSAGSPSLITGATGFIGRHLVRALTARGHPVSALVRDPARIDELPGARCRKGDLTEPGCLVEATKGAAVVYHLAAVVPGKGSRSRQWQVNCEGTRLLVRACIANGVGRLVFVSSVSVYAPPLAAIVDEGHPTGGADTYGQSKAAAEREIAKAASTALRCVILRPCQVYGPGDTSGYTARLRSLLGSRYAVAAGACSRPFSLVHVDDVVGAIVAAGAVPLSHPCAINVAGPSLTSLRMLAAAHRSITGRAPKLVPMPAAAIRFASELRWMSRTLAADAARPHWKSYGPSCVHGSLLLGGPEYSLHRLRSELGFVPSVSVREGLANLLRDQAEPGVSE
jgi:nucleoside-diphosphate-sugar epimerase